MILYQLPVYSPLTAGAIARAVVAGRDERSSLAEQLARDGWANAILTDSGTSALAVALQLAHTARSLLPCALPAYGCYDLVTAALAANVPIRLYDIDPHTLGPDVDSLGRALQEGCSSVVLVYPFGLDVGGPALTRLVRSSGATLIADCAQADGLELDSQQADLLVRSFGRGKGWSGGGGGALVFGPSIRLSGSIPASRGKVSDTLRFALLSGAQWLLGRPSLYRLPMSIPALGLGETNFKTPSPPRGIRPASARLALDTSRLLGAERKHRGEVAAFYDALALNDLGWRTPTRRAGSLPGWLRYPILGSPRAAESGDWRRLGIARGYPLPLHRLPQAQYRASVDERFLGAETIVEQLWTLPTHRYVSERWRSDIASWLKTSAPTSRP